MHKHLKKKKKHREKREPEIVEIRESKNRSLDFVMQLTLYKSLL